MANVTLAEYGPVVCDWEGNLVYATYVFRGHVFRVLPDNRIEKADEEDIREFFRMTREDSE